MGRILKILLFTVVVLAIAIRLIIFFQNRNFFIDEANLARNIYEKSYLALSGSLDYEQFAPPIFLWITKLNTSILGNSEFAFRLIPLLSSILSIFLLIKTTKLFTHKNAIIYPLALFAGSILHVQFATEFKQYSSDFCIAILLIFLAIKTKKLQVNRWWLIFWVVTGIIAIFISMPSVFVLFGVGLFWFYHFNEQKNRKAIIKIVGVIFFWLIPFLLYYFLLLKQQISSDYLQNFHDSKFLYFPKNIGSIMHNLRLLKSLITLPTGFLKSMLFFNSLIIIIAIIFLIKVDRAKLILLVSPILALLISSMLKKYVLEPRIVMFIHAYIYLLLAIGIGYIFPKINSFFRAVLIIIMLINVFHHQQFYYFKQKLEIQEIHYAFDFLLQNDDINDVWVHHGAVPSFHYYTVISPQKEKYTSLKDKATFFEWDTNYQQKLLKNQEEKIAILLTNYYESDRLKVEDEIRQSVYQLSVKQKGCLLYSIENK